MLHIRLTPAGVKICISYSQNEAHDSRLGLARHAHMNKHKQVEPGQTSVELRRIRT